MSEYIAGVDIARLAKAGIVLEAEVVHEGSEYVDPSYFDDKRAASYRVNVGGHNHVMGIPTQEQAVTIAWFGYNCFKSGQDHKIYEIKKALKL